MLFGLCQKISSLLQIKQVTMNLERQKGSTDDHNMDSSPIQADKMISLDKGEGKCSNVQALDKVKQVLFLLCCVYYFII
jgi:hypothetical protein